MAGSRKIQEVAGQAALDEIAGVIPCGSIALAMVQAVFSNCADRRARDLFSAIGERIGAEDWNAAARKLEKNIGKRWFDETMERGFRDIIESVCPEARRCIGFLVAEYLDRETKPDSTFLKVGWLLRESTKGELRTFSTICEMYAELPAVEEAGLRVLIRASKRYGELGLFWFAAHQGDSSILGERIIEPENLEACVRALVTHRIGNYWTGLSSHTFEGDPILRFNKEDSSAFRLLRSCLRVLNQQDVETPSATKARTSTGNPRVGAP